MLYQVNPPGPGVQYWILDLETREAQPITTPSVSFNYLRSLPDGEHVLYLTGPPDQADIWLLEIEEGR